MYELVEIIERSKEKEQKDQVSLRGIHGATAGSGERRYRLRG